MDVVAGMSKKEIKFTVKDYKLKIILLYNRMNERRTLGGRKNGSSERAFKS